jgi:DNA gyrase/topoisomerase IV subunit B
MKSLISNLFRKLKNQVVDNSSAARSIADYNRELLVKQGRDQFMKLIDKGLTIPVNLV